MKVECLLNWEGSGRGTVVRCKKGRNSLRHKQNLKTDNYSVYSTIAEHTHHVSKTETFFQLKETIAGTGTGLKDLHGKECSVLKSFVKMVD